jgi:sugar lactone lactonase YvrE
VFPQFSPDGKRIVYYSNSSGSDQIWLCNADGSNAAPITSMEAAITATPRWSPDGGQITFDSNASGMFQVYVVRAEGGKPRQMTEDRITSFGASWSRDGRWIYFAFAGGGLFSILGDGGPAANAGVAAPTSVALDGAGNVYIADSLGGRIRKVDTAGIITTVAGNGSSSGPIGDGGPATSARVAPDSVAVDGAGNLYITDFVNQRIRKVNTAGIISTVAGTNTNGSRSTGDGGPATSAVLFAAHGLAVDNAGNLYFTDSPGIRKVVEWIGFRPVQRQRRLQRGRDRPFQQARSPSAPACSPPAKPQDPSTLAARRRSVRSRRTRSAKTLRGTPR